LLTVRNECNNGLNIQENEITKIIQGDKNVFEAVSRFISTAGTRIDACVDQTRPALGTDIEQIRALVLNSHKRGVRLRCITEITTNNIHYCKQLEIVDELRHLDNIVGTFYVSDIECLVPESIHKKSKLASQIIYWNVKETVKHQQYVFETLWNKAISAEQKINQIEKGELPEVIEIIHDTNEAQLLAHKLVRAAEKEVLVVFSSSNAFIRQVNAGGGQLVIKVANSRNVNVVILTPMNEVAKIMAKDLESQSTNIQIRAIEPSSRSTVSAVIVDRKFSIAVELKDDSKSTPQEAIGTSIYSTSKSTVLSYVSMFESLLKLTELYEESQSKLSDTTDELESMKRYVKEVLEEMDKFKKSRV
jgi:two-component system, OmpR family, sensor histidine kinase VicK